MAMLGLPRSANGATTVTILTLVRLTVITDRNTSPAGSSSALDRGSTDGARVGGDVAGDAAGGDVAGGDAVLVPVFTVQASFAQVELGVGQALGVAPGSGAASLADPSEASMVAVVVVSTVAADTGKQPASLAEKHKRLAANAVSRFALPLNEIWCARRDSNSRPIAPEAIALSS